METVAVLTIILAAVCVLTECRSPPIEPYPYPPPENACLTKLDQCSQPLQQNSFIGGVSTDHREIFNNIDAVCEAYQTFADCFRPSIHFCNFPEIRHQIDAALSIGDYLCSDHGKSLLREFKDSECYEDRSKLEDLEGYSQVCTAEVLSNLQSFEAAENDRCQIVSDVFECVARKATEQCGSALGQITAAVTDRLMAVYSNNECQNDITFKRAIEYFKRRGRDFFIKKSLN